MKVAWGAIALFVVLSASLIGGWQFARRKERLAFETRLEVTSQQVALRLEAFLTDRLESIEGLGQLLDAGGQVREPDFRLLSAGLQRRHSGFLALSWMNPEGVIEWVEPREPNAAVEGISIDTHPVAGPAWRRSRTARTLVATRPVELLQGGWGFAVYRPVLHGQEIQGYLNGVFRFREVFAECLGSERDGDFNYLLHDGERLVGAHGPHFSHAGPLPGSMHDVHIAGKVWHLTVQAPAQPSGAAGAWSAELQLGLGILLAALLAWMVQVAHARQVRSDLSRARLQVLVENAPDAIVSIDMDSGCFVDSNANALALFGLTDEQLQQVGPGDLSPQTQPDGRDSKSAMAEHLAAASEGETLRFDWIHTNAAGLEIPTLVHLVRLPDSGHRHVRGSIIDLSDQRALENQLLSSQKMEAMGRLAGSVAHDFNNLLTGILGASEMIGLRVQGDEQLSELTSEISHTCDRAADLTRQLLAFSRNQVVKHVPLDLSEVVRGSVSMLERVLGQRIHLECELDPALFSVMADAGQMELAILNLAINARDAMPGGGTITVKTRTRTSSEAGRRVLLEVIDTGTGIPPDRLEQIFEPFFTTKQPGVGTGIGLATVKQIVTQAGGEIRVHSAEGQGTTFTIDLPGIEARPPAPPRPTPVPEVEQARGTVLLVEDEGSIRRAAQDSLERAGYLVLSGASAEQALDLTADFDGPIDLLVTDVMLPGIPGIELAARFATTHPETAVLLISGYSRDSFDLSGLVGEKLQLLPKPFSPSDLTRKASQLLAARASRLVV